jgi:hypothetical protein
MNKTMKIVTLAAMAVSFLFVTQGYGVIKTGASKAKIVCVPAAEATQGLDQDIANKNEAEKVATFSADGAKKRCYLIFYGDSKPTYGDSKPTIECRKLGELGQIPTHEYSYTSLSSRTAPYCFINNATQDIVDAIKAVGTSTNTMTIPGYYDTSIRKLMSSHTATLTNHVNNAIAGVPVKETATEQPAKSETEPSDINEPE